MWIIPQGSHFLKFQLIIVYLRFYVGYYFAEAGLYKKAIEAYKQAIRIEPDLAEAHYGLGFTYLMLNNRGSALEEYKILKTFDPEMANKLFNSIYE